MFLLLSYYLLHSVKCSLLQSISHRPIPRSLYALLSLLHLSLQIKHVFFKISKTCGICETRLFKKLVGSTVADIFILFRNICNDVAFNRAILIKTVVLYENPEKAITVLVTLLNFACNKLVNVYNFVNKLSTVTKNRYNRSYKHSYSFSSWCLLKGHTYLNKPAAERCRFV